MLRNLSRSLRWGLALALMCALVAAWGPVAAQVTGAPALDLSSRSDQAAVAIEAAAQLGDLHDATGAPLYLSATKSEPHGGASWHRGAGRRSHRDPSSLLLPNSRAGSIPAADSFYFRCGGWHVVPRPPVHGTGQLAAPPRAPPR
jgi:hypothetical protein